ncbi:MAG: hypothetical protein QXY45_04090, partial [Candidatus Aenigmatarchaeota archaeon]
AISLVEAISTDFQDFSKFRSVNYNWPQGNQIMGILSNNFSNFLIDSLSVRYVFIPSDEYNETFKHYGPKEYFLSSTDQLKYLTKLDWNLTNVSVYENEDYYPHIYSPDVYYITDVGSFNYITKNYERQDIQVNFEPENIIIKEPYAYIPYNHHNQTYLYEISNDSSEIKLNLQNLTLGDCNSYDQRTFEQLQFSMKYENETLEMTALDHIACVYLPFDKIEGFYKLTITYRTLSGHPARFGIWQHEARKLIRFDPEKNSEWETKEYIFEVFPNTTKPSLGLYAQGNGDEFTRVQYKDIKISYIKTNKTYDTIIKEMKNFTDKMTIELRNKVEKDDKRYAFIFFDNNIIEQNNNFYYIINDPFEGQKMVPLKVKERKILIINLTEENTKVGDCNRYDQRTFEELKISKEVSNNQIKITAKAHTACLYFPFNYTKDGIYILNITYRGDSPSFTVWQEGPKEHIRFQTKKTKEWVTKQFQFEINPETTKPSLGLFAQGNELDIIENYYANISITEIQLSEKTIIEKTQKKPDIIYRMINPTKYIVEVKNATEPFIIIFGDSYHPEWKAFVREKGEIVGWIEAMKTKSEKHFEANGWANGFAIENCNNDCTITIYFRPQSYFYIGSAISATTFACCVGYLIYDWKKGWFIDIRVKFLDLVERVKERKKYRYKHRLGSR